jgi:hypothetical protein
MSKKFRNLLLGAGVVIGMSSSAFAGPTRFEQFESCKAAQDAVRDAGSNGLATDKPFYAVVYDEPQCYRGNTSGFTSFAEERKIAGEQCMIGYVCEDDIPSQ